MLLIVTAPFLVSVLFPVPVPVLGSVLVNQLLDIAAGRKGTPCMNELTKETVVLQAQCMIIGFEM